MWGEIISSQFLLFPLFPLFPIPVSTDNLLNLKVLGFVGSNLLRQSEFHKLYNSRNITDIQGQEFDYLVWAGAPAVKWLANKEPENDRENLLNLMNCLQSVKTQKLVLISPVYVYLEPLEVDEDTPTGNIS